MCSLYTSVVAFGDVTNYDCLMYHPMVRANEQVWVGQPNCIPVV